MKLHVILDKDSGELVAYSHERKNVDDYYDSLPIERRNKYKVGFINNKTAIEQIENRHFDKQVFAIDGMEVVDIEENKNLYNMSIEEYDKLGFIMKDLKNIEQNYSISKKDKKKLKQARKIVKALREPENFKMATGSAVTESISKHGNIILARLFNLGR